MKSAVFILFLVFVGCKKPLEINCQGGGATVNAIFLVDEKGFVEKSKFFTARTANENPFRPDTNCYKFEADSAWIEMEKDSIKFVIRYVNSAKITSKPKL